MSIVWTTIRAAAAIAAVCVLLPASQASASDGWSRALTLPLGHGHLPLPRASIAHDGTSVLAFRSRDDRLMLATAPAGGRLGTPRVIDERGAIDWSLVARPRGGFLLVWEDRDGIRAAVRAKRGSPVLKRRVTASNGATINAVLAAYDPHGGYVVAERQFRSGLDSYFIRAMSLDADGRLDGAVQELGPGEFGLDVRQTRELAVSAQGRAILAFRRWDGVAGRGPVVVSTRSHRRPFSTPVPLTAGLTADPWVAADDRGRALVAATRVLRAGRADDLGDPVVAGLDPLAAPLAPFGPLLADRRQVFGPVAAYVDQGRSVLIFQTRVGARFDRKGPIRAVAIGSDNALGAAQTLTIAAAKGPVALSLSRGRALALWSDERGIDAAIADESGRFRATSGPGGPPPSGRAASTNTRWFAARGRFAIFAWSRQDDGLLRVAVREFPR